MELLPLPELGTTPAKVLTIAGSDSGGGAGIEAELRTFALTGIHALVALTAVTVQNTLGVQAVYPLPPQLVVEQIAAVNNDIGFQAVKTGVLANKHIIYDICAYFQENDIGNMGNIPLVVDPVSVSMHGNPLLESDAIDALRYELLPLATIATPNLDEVSLITGIHVDEEKAIHRAAEYFLTLGTHSVIIKGGHAQGIQGTQSIDYIFTHDRYITLAHPRITNNGNDHGAGDTLAAAITAALAVGYDLLEAVTFAKAWVSKSVEAAYPLGKGHGPVNAMWRLYP